MSEFIIGVVGNPNCGKTTLFNSLTGSKQRVGNWPGVTVDQKTGWFNIGKKQIEIIDTPGIYSLAASSLDEQVTRDFVLSKKAQLIVNIVDASNIERNLYLTSQLLEMKVPMIVALNMMDVAKENNLEIDAAGLAEKLGCPVIPLVATRSNGVEALKLGILSAVEKPAFPSAEIVYPAAINEAIQALASLLAVPCRKAAIDPQWLALKFLEGDEHAESYIDIPPAITEKISLLQTHIEEQEEEEPDIVIASARYGFVSSLTDELVRRKGQVGEKFSQKLDRIVLNRILGIPLFLVAMYVMFMFTINLGGAFIDFFDQLFGTIFVDGFSVLLTAIHCPDWLITILANGIGGGLQTIATFIPPIGFMFIFLSFLEDSGYMARAAFVMDRFMRFVGLPGKAFVPMLVGFGCNVPAIMATRTLENDRDRLLTVMMNPFMSCGARMPVYALFAAAFFPTGGQNLVFLLYLIGICFAIFTGLVLKHTLLKGQVTPFVMEMPPYHLPSFKSVILRSYDRLKAFLFRAGKVIIPIVVILSFMNSLGTNGTFGNDDTDNSVLSFVGKSITPLFHPLGIEKDNWPATVGIFTGIFAKEAVVGTLDSLYAGIDNQQNQESGAVETEQPAEEEGFDFWGGITGAFATIPDNLAGIIDTVTDPLGISVGDVSTIDEAASEQEVDKATFGSMQHLFGGATAAFAYLLFVLLYFPCCAAIAAVYRETNLRWTLFAGFWTTFLAYMASSLFYQIATFANHPPSSLLIVLIDIVLIVAVLLIMRSLSLKQHKKEVSLMADVPAN